MLSQQSRQGAAAFSPSIPIVCEDAPEQRPWHVLHVRSNCEKRVAQHLAARGIEHYLPLYRERVRWTDRSVVAERALFKGYLFTRFQPEARITIVSTPGAVRLLGDETGHLVTCAELDRIREGMANGLLIRPHPHVAVGERVRIRRGIFEGVEGVVAEFRQQCKVIIALAAVRQCFSLEMEFGDFEVLKNLSPQRASMSRPANPGWSLRPAQP